MKEAENLASCCMKDPIFVKPLRLIPRIQHYHWGSNTKSSLVGKIAIQNYSNILLTDGTNYLDKLLRDEPFAELWFGAHQELPCEIINNEKIFNLRQIIDKIPLEMLGRNILENYGRELPFLFKILSIANPLSIQAHPDKVLAAKLYRYHNYPDSNHKPELAIALCDSELLCGFRHLSDMAVDFARIPALKQAIGDELFTGLINKEQDESGILKAICRKLISNSKDTIANLSEQLKLYLSTLSSPCKRDKWVSQLLTNIYSQDDVGVFILYMMNLVCLTKGEAIFIPPNTAHAYLSGEMAECMANSDNVVRGGLTPKHKDVDIFVDMLDYRARRPNIIKPRLDSKVIKYCPQSNEKLEFEVTMLQDGAELKVQANTPCIFLSVTADGKMSYKKQGLCFSQGDAYFIPAFNNTLSIISNHGYGFFISVPE